MYRGYCHGVLLVIIHNLDDEPRMAVVSVRNPVRHYSIPCPLHIVAERSRLKYQYLGFDHHQAFSPRPY